VDPRFLTVGIAFEYNVCGERQPRHSHPAQIQWVTTVVNGQWKIDRRL
jgi:hypothetical protein